MVLSRRKKPDLIYILKDDSGICLKLGHRSSKSEESRKTGWLLQ